MTLPLLGFRRTTERAVHHPLVWLARELSLDALSGQAGTFTRAATKTSTDSFATSGTVNYAQPAWSGASTLASLDMGTSDVLKWVSPFGVQACSGMIQFYENGSLAGSKAIFAITNDTPVAPLLLIFSSGTQYQIQHNNAISTVTSTMSGTAPTSGQLVQLRWRILSTGSVQIFQSINGAAETTATASGTLALGAAWASPTAFYLNSSGSGTIVGTSRFVGACVLQGTIGQTALQQVLA